MPRRRDARQRGAAPINGVAYDGLITDKALSSDALVTELNERGAKVVISPRLGRAQRLMIDTTIYAWHHFIESFFC